MRFRLILLLLSASPLAAHSDRLGTIAFPTSGAPEAQKDFIRGVLYLHSFEYDDAAEAFRAAQQKGPEFVMAHWGEAMTYTHPVCRTFQRRAPCSPVLQGASRDKAGSLRALRAVAEEAASLPVEFGPPDFVKPPYELLGEWYLEDGRHAEAKQALERSLALMPGRLISVRGLNEVSKALAVAPRSER